MPFLSIHIFVHAAAFSDTTRAVGVDIDIAHQNSGRCKNGSNLQAMRIDHGRARLAANEGISPRSRLLGGILWPAVQKAGYAKGPVSDSEESVIEP